MSGEVVCNDPQRAAPKVYVVKHLVWADFPWVLGMDCNFHFQIATYMPRER